MKVVCVNAKNYFLSGKPNALRLNTVYEVLADHGWAYSLVGFPSDCMLAFSKQRFRPVVEKKTDISVFQKILDNPKQRITETVE